MKLKDEDIGVGGDTKVGEGDVSNVVGVVMGGEFNKANGSTTPPMEEEVEDGGAIDGLVPFITEGAEWESKGENGSTIPPVVLLDGAVEAAMKSKPILALEGGLAVT